MRNANIRNANIHILASMAVAFCCVRLSSAIMSRKVPKILQCLVKQEGKQRIKYDSIFLFLMNSAICNMHVRLMNNVATIKFYNDANVDCATI